MLVVGNKADLKREESKEQVETIASATNGDFCWGDWELFLERVVTRNGKDEIIRANQIIENYNSDHEIEVNWVTKIKKWLRPPELPFFKKIKR